MRTLALLCAGFLGLAGAAVPAAAQDAESFHWRMANLYPRGTSFGAVYQAFTDEVAAMSDGRLVIDNVYDGEGVPATEVYGATRTGLVEMGSPYMALHTGEMPLGVIELGLPGAPTELTDLMALFYEGGWLEELRAAYQEQGLYYLGPFFQPGVYLLTKTPVTTLADLDGLKIRAPGAYGSFVRGLDVSPVTMSFAETYTSLATGVIDGAASSNLIDYRDGQFVEQAKYLYPVPVTGSQVSSFIVNLDAWNSLPDDLKAILDTAAYRYGVDMAVKSSVWEQQAVAEMTAKGLEWSPAPSAEDMARWQQAGQSLWAEYEAQDPHSGRLIELMRTFMAGKGAAE